MAEWLHYWLLHQDDAPSSALHYWINGRLQLLMQYDPKAWFLPDPSSEVAKPSAKNDEKCLKKHLSNGSNGSNGPLYIPISSITILWSSLHLPPHRFAFASLQILERLQQLFETSTEQSSEKSRCGCSMSYGTFLQAAAPGGFGGCFFFGGGRGVQTVGKGRGFCLKGRRFFC